MDSTKFNLFIVLASAIITDKDKILLLLRSDKNKTFRSCWQLPEGKLEKDEQAEDALLREIKEELGWKTKINQLLTTSTTSFEFNQHQLNILRIVFKISHQGKISLSEDHSQLALFTIKEAVNLPNLVPGLKEILIKIEPEL